MTVQKLSPYVIGFCKAEGCGIPLIPDWRWRRLSPAARAGHACHRGKGMCQKHMCRFNRRGETSTYQPPSRTPKTAAEVPVSACGECKVSMATPRHLDRFPELRDRGIIRKGGHGLCNRCYRRARTAGTVEPTVRRRDEVLDEWAMLRDTGTTDLREAAERMGMTWTALDMALYRARKDGDPRASLVPFGHDMRRNAA